MYTRFKETGPETIDTDIDLLVNGSSVASWTGTTGHSHALMKGVDIPNFHKRKARGDLLPHTPFYQSESTSKQTSGVYKLTRHSDGSTEEAVPLLDFLSQGIDITVTSSDVAAAQAVIGESSYHLDSLVQAAAANIISKGFDASTFLAEAIKLRQLFVGLLKRFLTILSSRSIRELSDGWLEGRYGWRTLYFDIVNFIDAVNEFDAERTRYSERVGTSIQGSVILYDVESTTSGGHSHERIETLYWDISARGFVTADFVPSQFRTNAISTAWELVPLSFVIDWFFSVGSSIDSFFFHAFSTHFEGSQGTVKTYQKEIVWYSTAPAAGWDYDLDMQSTAKLILTKRRPASVSYSPYSRVNLSGLKIIDLLTLLWQRVT